jgi:NAD(P)-dependent dehydrogenase (short-subunit alcohol dehydrogenase family)
VNLGRETSTALVFGANGALGSEIVAALDRDGFSVTAAVRTMTNCPQATTVLVLGDDPLNSLSQVDSAQFSAVVWAQGANLNDDIETFAKESLDGLLDANLIYVMETMSFLVSNSLVADGARFCILSSIWQHLSRRHKLSYTVTKAALGGLVRAASADLASRQILINAVLPGVIDTPMTRSVLTAEQVQGIAEATGFGRLATAVDVAEAVSFLCSSRNRAITGQSLTVDLGFGHVRKI